MAELGHAGPHGRGDEPLLVPPRKLKTWPQLRHTRLFVDRPGHDRETPSNSVHFFPAISLISGFHRAISCSICARYCAGVVLTVLAPALPMDSFTSGSSAILTKISDSLRMSGSGVLDGAMIPFHVSAIKLGTAVSCTEGRCGK